MNAIKLIEKWELEADEHLDIAERIDRDYGCFIGAPFRQKAADCQKHADELRASLPKNPDAWAVQNSQGYWVGIWNDKETAQDVMRRQVGKGDELIPVYLGAASHATDSDMILLPREPVEFLVDNYLANAGTDGEFICCITPKGMDNKYGRAWKSLYQSITRHSGGTNVQGT